MHCLHPFALTMKVLTKGMMPIQLTKILACMISVAAHYCSRADEN